MALRPTRTRTLQSLTIRGPRQAPARGMTCASRAANSWHHQPLVFRAPLVPPKPRSLYPRDATRTWRVQRGVRGYGAPVRRGAGWVGHPSPSRLFRVELRDRGRVRRCWSSAALGVVFAGCVVYRDGEQVKAGSFVRLPACGLGSRFPIRDGTTPRNPPVRVAPARRYIAVAPALAGAQGPGSLAGRTFGPPPAVGPGGAPRGALWADRPDRAGDVVRVL